MSRRPPPTPPRVISPSPPRVASRRLAPRRSRPRAPRSSRRQAPPDPGPPSLVDRNMASSPRAGTTSPGAPAPWSATRPRPRTAASTPSCSRWTTRWPKGTRRPGSSASSEPPTTASPRSSRSPHRPTPTRRRSSSSSSARRAPRARSATWPAATRSRCPRPWDPAST